MSYDLYFWPADSTDEPGLLAERLAEEEVDELVPDERILAFRAELLRRWHELAGMIAPWHEDLDWRQPWGRTDLADRLSTASRTGSDPLLVGGDGRWSWLVRRGRRPCSLDLLRQRLGPIR